MSWMSFGKTLEKPMKDPKVPMKKQAIQLERFFRQQHTGKCLDALLPYKPCS